MAFLDIGGATLRSSFAGCQQDTTACTLCPPPSALPALVLAPLRPVAELVKGWPANKTQRHLDRAAGDRQHDRETSPRTAT